MSRQILPRIWQAEWGLSAMLVSLILALFVGGPVAAIEGGRGLLFDVLFSTLILSGVVTVSHRRSLRIGVCAVSLATLVLRWALFWHPGSALRIWSQALSIVSLAILTVLVLTQVFRDGPITGYRIQGAIAVYLLLGLIWAVGYELVYHLLPGAFRLAQGDVASVAHGLVYFSFVTLTTVGYGDIMPVHPVVRSLAVAEALVGQLYPVILIARLVSMEVESRRRQ